MTHRFSVSVGDALKAAIEKASHAGESQSACVRRLLEAGTHSGRGDVDSVRDEVRLLEAKIERQKLRNELAHLEAVAADPKRMTALEGSNTSPAAAVRSEPAPSAPTREASAAAPAQGKDERNGAAPAPAKGGRRGRGKRCSPHSWGAPGADHMLCTECGHRLDYGFIQQAHLRNMLRVNARRPDFCESLVSALQVWREQNGKAPLSV